MKLLVANGRQVVLGNGVTSGNLATPSASGDPNEWPMISALGTTWNGLKVQGVSGSLSAVDLDGLRLDSLANNVSNFDFTDYYGVTKFDNIVFDKKYTNAATAASIKLQNCANGTFNDASWTGINLVDISTMNVDASSCTSGGPITIAGSGGAFGQSLELDPNNIINWTNGASFTCSWTGAVDTAWTTAGNWNNCANGRGNYPDINDTIVIGSGGNQPVVTGDHGFASLSSGGGTVTIASSSSLRTNATTLTSSIGLRGDTATCSTCLFMLPNSLTVSNAATLTLGKGVALTWQQVNRVLRFGDGTTGGNLVTTGGSIANEMPMLMMHSSINSSWNGVIVQGGAGSSSAVSIDGLKINDVQAATNDIYFQANYSLNQFDNVLFDPYGSNVSTPVIRIGSLGNCANGFITDTSWNGLSFANSIMANGTAFNILSSACNFASIDIYPHSGGGVGYGSAYESDPFGVFNWH